MNISSNPDIQIQKGREAMVYFHNDSVVYPNYNLTLDALIHQVSKGKDSIFLEGFGFAIEQLNTDGFFSGNVVKNAMEKFARRAQGRVPDNMSAFFNALSNEATQVNWVDATGYVAKEKYRSPRNARSRGNGITRACGREEGTQSHRTLREPP
jgi:hypothetical protein